MCNGNTGRKRKRKGNRSSIWYNNGWKFLQISVRCQTIDSGSSENNKQDKCKTNKLPKHVTCLLRNLYAGQEATVRTGHGTTDCLQIGKGVHQGCILSPCLFNLYAKYIMRNTELEEAQAGINTARRNINNLWYADDTNLMAESKDERKSLLMKVKD